MPSERPMTAARASAILAAVLLCGVAAPPAGAETDIQQFVTPAGIEVWYVQEESLPLIALEVLFQNAGAATDPVGKEGLAELVSVTLDEGAADIESFEFLRRIEELALRLRFRAGSDTFGVEMRTLSENREQSFNLLGLALNRPRFDENPVGRMRSALLADLERRAEDPDDIVSQAWLAAAFPGHPYGRGSRGTVETMAALTPADLREFVTTRFTRDRMIVGAVGDVDAQEIGRLVDLALAGLPLSGPRFEIPDTTVAPGERLVVVRRDISQSTAFLGTPGIAREDPDYYAASLLNTVLGGASFISRLWAEVREERGLAYSVGTFIAPLRHAAYFLAAVATRNDALEEVVDIIRSEVEKVAREGITEEELAAAKTYSIGRFALSMDDSAGVAGVLVGLQVSELGADYIRDRPGLIDAVTGDDIRRVARRLFLGGADADPDAAPVEFVTAIVGDPVGFEEAGD